MEPRPGAPDQPRRLLRLFLVLPVPVLLLLCTARPGVPVANGLVAPAPVATSTVARLPREAPRRGRHRPRPFARIGPVRRPIPPHGHPPFPRPPATVPSLGPAAAFFALTLALAPAPLARRPHRPAALTATTGEPTTRTAKGAKGAKGATPTTAQVVEAALEAAAAAFEAEGTADAPFPLLDPAGRYTHASPGVCDACAADGAVREQWVDLLLGQLPNHEATVRRTAAALPAREAAAELERYAAWQEAYRRDLAYAERAPGTTLLRMVEEKERLLQEHGLPDLFRGLKDTETAAALTLYPLLRDEIDARLRSDGAVPALQLALECALAGNLFDAGAAAAVAGMASDAGASQDTGSADAVARTYGLTRRRCARPRGGRWRYDDFDEFAQRAATRPWRRAVLFCDNAGADAVGLLLLARQLLATARASGVAARVVLAANSSPALNDITAAELRRALATAAQGDADLAALLLDGSLLCLPTGQGTTLLDLSRCGAALNGWVAAEMASVPPGEWLVVLAGMGRALESNWEAGRYFRDGVDVLSVALIKSEINASRLGACVYDCVVRLQRAGAPAAAR